MSLDFLKPIVWAQNGRAQASAAPALDRDERCRHPSRRCWEQSQARGGQRVRTQEEGLLPSYLS